MLYQSNIKKKSRIYNLIMRWFQFDPSGANKNLGVTPSSVCIILTLTILWIIQL